VHARLGDYVMIHPRQRIRPQTIGKDVIPPDAVVENSNVAGLGLSLQPLRQDVGPAIVAVGGGAMSIGD